MLLISILALASAPLEAKKPAADDKTMICFRDTTTGSLISHRTCRTAEQLRRQREETIASSTRLMDGGSINSCGAAASACAAASAGPGGPH